jgi:peroxiredoxin (alkyl hydroperoxide reductase subunit C)
LTRFQIGVGLRALLPTARFKEENMALRVGEPVSDHTVEAYVRGERAPSEFALSSHRGSWIVLFFYPRDFTFICPTELAAFAERHDDFLRERAVVLAASTDSYFSHKAWFESDPRLAEVRYPVIADTAHKLSRSFDVLLEDGATHRGTFIVDPTGMLLHMSVNEHDVGRSVDEVLRILQAFRTGALCPADWAPGKATLTSEDDWLAKVFPDLAGPELGSLAEEAEKVSFAAGDTIVSEGDAADRFYVIATGEVAITRQSPEGDEIELATLGPGQFFGEVGLLAETRRTATVRAVGDVELLALSWQEFQETLERSDRAERDFSEIVQERLAPAP